MSKWLIFEKTERKKGKKTDLFNVRNSDTYQEIGRIYWYGGFRKYIFAPSDNIIFDAGCLSSIAYFINSLMDERKVNSEYAEKC